ncbi:hypothetical protein AB4Y38_12415 [Paraburkholderia sp. EG285A]|uniref:hypothetical protein n=1 Tax=Paraburkholderia sp. EG285A TaxID=3237009 RepID=UPI0034D24291
MVLLDPKKGIGDATVQHRIGEWLVDVHGDDLRCPEPTGPKDGEQSSSYEVEGDLPPEERFPDDDVSDTDIQVEVQENHRKILAGGLLLTSADLQTALSMSPQELGDATHSKRFFTVDVDGKDYYPAFFVNSGFDLQVLERISELLGSLPGWVKWLFFTSPRETLGDVNALEALASGREALVNDVAQRFAADADN